MTPLKSSERQSDCSELPTAIEPSAARIDHVPERRNVTSFRSHRCHENWMSRTAFTDRMTVSYDKSICAKLSQPSAHSCMHASDLLPAEPHPRSRFHSTAVSVMFESECMFSGHLCKLRTVDPAASQVRTTCSEHLTTHSLMGSRCWPVNCMSETAPWPCYPSIGYSTSPVQPQWSARDAYTHAYSLHVRMMATPLKSNGMVIHSLFKPMIKQCLGAFSFSLENGIPGVCPFLGFGWIFFRKPRQLDWIPFRFICIGG